MAAFDPILAEFRFGCGLSPNIAPPADVQAMLASLTSPDVAAKRYPVEDFTTFLTRIQQRLEYQRIRRDNRGTPEAAEAKEGIAQVNRNARIAQFNWMAQQLCRRIASKAPFRERLTGFWSDHFTATGKRGVLRRGASPYVETAIRPHMTGKFEDLLIAAVTHPLMVHYLDQDDSIGPNSARAQNSKGKRPTGLNENLAREIMELHTLGVGGPYTQADVREFAELLTGLTMHPIQGRQFRVDMSEPGPKTVLGKSYGKEKGRYADIEEALRDLARHPSTARHLAEKLATHFVSDTPDADLVAAIETAFLDSGTDLMAGYTAMLEHSAAWDESNPNVKQPFDFIGSSLRALAVDPQFLLGLKENVFRQRIQFPLVLMGHVWEKPDGPDGLAEDDAAWVTPQGLATRLQWAVTVPQFLQRDLPDPRDFVVQALGSRATPAVNFAAKAAESRADGVGLILASPAFQRM